MALSPAEQIEAARAAAESGVGRDALLAYLKPVAKDIPTPEDGTPEVEAMIADVQALAGLSVPPTGTPWVEVWLRAAASMAKGGVPAVAKRLEALAEKAGPLAGIKAAEIKIPAEHLPAMIELLKRSFATGQFKAFVTYLPGGDAVAKGIDWDQPMSQLAFDVAMALNNKGLYTNAFWSAWAALLPGLKNEIKALRAQIAPPV